jgi:hypothetical protein
MERDGGPRLYGSVGTRVIQNCAPTHSGLGGQATRLHKSQSVGLQERLGTEWRSFSESLSYTKPTATHHNHGKGEEARSVFKGLSEKTKQDGASWPPAAATRRPKAWTSDQVSLPVTAIPGLDLDLTMRMHVLMMERRKIARNTH